MKICAAHNIKGARERCSAAVNLAYLAGRDGLRVLLWDLDPQAAATYMFRIRARVKGGGGSPGPGDQSPGEGRRRRRSSGWPSGAPVTAFAPRSQAARRYQELRAGLREHGALA